jgi:uncharacterized protein DUF4167
MHGTRPNRPEQRHPRRRPARAARHPSTVPSGNAQRNYERYLALAREASLNGDAVEAENCYQHAEHYFRVMRGQRD